MTRAKRRKTVFVCNECGGTSPAWSGKCPHCSEWNTLVEETLEKSSTSGLMVTGDCKPRILADIGEEEAERLSTGIDELDRVLGGGIFPGSMNLIGGEPGIGKSTLMLQLAMAGTPGSDLVLLSATSLDAIERELSSNDYPVLIVDSIQSIYSPDLTSSPGSVSQVRHCAANLLALTKPRSITSFIVGHVTKGGSLAGPKVLEHLVDAVIYFEGDGSHSYRLLRAAKNRFGSTNELGIFEMTAQGLQCVSDASSFFLRREGAALPGTVVVAVMEGSRPFLVEIQALTSHTRYGYPQRSVNGFDSKRLPMLLAVLEKRCGMDLGSQDVYVNVAGGTSLCDPGADLGICVAVASSRLDRPVRRGVALCGEVGLGGELRPVARFNRRLSEVLRLGFNTLAGSAEDAESCRDKGARGYSGVSNALEHLLEEVHEGGNWV